MTSIGIPFGGVTGKVRLIHESVSNRIVSTADSADSLTQILIVPLRNPEIWQEKSLSNYCNSQWIELLDLNA
jgi:hypothetical protein